MRTLTGAVFCAIVIATGPLVRAEALAPTKPEDVGLSSDRLARIGKVFGQEIDQGRLPGVVVAIARKGKLAYYESFGFRDKAAGAPMPKDAIFRIYSMTKPLASVAAATLMEEGRLQLTDPVAKWLPEFANLQVSEMRTDAWGKVSYALVPAERPPTVQDLLRHSAGLAYGELTGNAAVKDAYTKAGVYKSGIDYEVRDLAPAEEVERLAKAPLAHQPGTAWEYSLAVDVLGRVVEKVSGQRLGDLLQQRLFAPLGMVDTGFAVPPERMGRVAEPLPNDPVTGAPNRMIDVSKVPANDSGGAGGVSTALDYLRFGEMMLENGQLDGTRILSPTTVSLMTADHLGTQIKPVITPGEMLMGTPGYTFGLGFMVRKEAGIAGVPGTVGEFMWAGYGGTFFWVEPKEQLVAVFMAQQPGPSRVYYRKEIKQLVEQAIVD
jgi:CubicO group peptidase (beta-lactamase class C family)